MRSFQISNPHFEEPLMESQNPQQLHVHETHPNSFCVQFSCCCSLTTLLPWHTQGLMTSTAQSSWMLAIPATSPEPFPREEPSVMPRCEKELPQKGWLSPSPTISHFCGVYTDPLRVLCLRTLAVLFSNTKIILSTKNFTLNVREDKK